MRSESILIEVVDLLCRNRNLLIETVKGLDLTVLRRKLRAQLIQVLLALGRRSHQGRDQKAAGHCTDADQHANRDLQLPPSFSKIRHQRVFSWSTVGT